MTQRTKKQCSIDGCENTGKLKRGWCSKHYERWRKYGSTSGGGRSYSDPEEAFLARIQWQGECLAWTGAKDEDGYGSIRVKGRTVGVYRYAWERAHGKIPSEMLIDHRCQNPPCVNVEHLRLATRSQNNAHLKGPRKHNRTSGVRNVTRIDNKWMVRVRKDTKSHYFGVYDTIEEASKVAEQARKELFNEYAGKG